MKDIKFSDGKVIIPSPKRPKKITGTRFGAVLDANRWQTPFQAWCEMTKAYCKPFDGSIYTEAGHVIEGKQLDWFSRLLPVVRPEDVYGKDFFDRTHGDFFPEDKIFGGMWDSLVGTKDDVQGVIECKTTKRAEDWQNDIPEYYALQAALYAYLMGVESVYMIVTFLDEGDYENPEKFVCNSDNTTYVHFDVHERYPEFDKYVDYCREFYNSKVLSGESPAFDEKADKEYLDALRTHVIEDDVDLLAMVMEAEKLYNDIEAVKATIKDKEKRLKEIEELMKKNAIESEPDDGSDSHFSVFKGTGIQWTVTKTTSMELDKDRLKADGYLDKYMTPTTKYVIRKSKIKGE